MELGVFSISLAVKDVRISKEFYEKLGFAVFGGILEEKWLIMKNGSCIIGLFEGMFDKNILTFNPGWDSNAKNVDPFMDVRELQEALRKQGIQIISEVGPDTEGPGSFIIEDPDGNPILLDQHR